MFRPSLKRNRTVEILEAIMDEEMKEAPPAKRQKRATRKSFPRYKKAYKPKTKDQIARLIHPFCEQYSIALWSSATAQGQSLQFALSNVGDFANYRTLFEQYRFNRMRLWAVPTQMNADVQAAALYVPTLYVAIDPNDNTAPASLDEVLQTGRAKMYTLDKKQVIADFTPTALFQVADGAGGTTTSTQQKRWYSLENVALQHYGVKIWIEPQISGNNGVRLIGEYYFDMKTGK